MPQGSKKGNLPRLRRPKSKGPKSGEGAGTEAGGVVTGSSAVGTGAGDRGTGAVAGAGGAGSRAGGTGAGDGGTGTRVRETGAETGGERTGGTGARETRTEAPSTTDASQEGLTTDRFLPNVDREENQDQSSKSAVWHPVQDNRSQDTTIIKPVPLMSLKVDSPTLMPQRVNPPPVMSQRINPPPLMSLKVDPPPFLPSTRDRNHPVKRDFGYSHYTGLPFLMDHCYQPAPPWTWRGRSRSPVPKNKIPLLPTPLDLRRPTVCSYKVETRCPRPQLDKIPLPLPSGTKTLPTSIDTQSLDTQHTKTHRPLSPETSLVSRNLPFLNSHLTPQTLPINSMTTPTHIPSDSMFRPLEPMDTSPSFHQRTPHINCFPVIKSSAPYLDPSYTNTLNDRPASTVSPDLMPLFPGELTINPQFLGSQSTSSPHAFSELHNPSLDTPTMCLPPKLPACDGVHPSMALNDGYPFSPQFNTDTSPFNLQQAIQAPFIHPGAIPTSYPPPTCPPLIPSGFIPPLHSHLMLSNILTPSRLQLMTPDIHSISLPRPMPPYIHSLSHPSLMSPESLLSAHTHPICPHMLPFSHHPQTLPNVLSFPNPHQNSDGIRSFAPLQPISSVSLSPPHLVSTDILSFSHPPLMSPDITSPSHTHSMSHDNQSFSRAYINSPGILSSSSHKATSQDVAFSHCSSRTSPDTQLHFSSSQNSISISSQVWPLSTSSDVRRLSSGTMTVPHLMSLNAEPLPPPTRERSSSSSSLSISLPSSTFQNIQPTSSEDLKIELDSPTPLYSKPTSSPSSDIRTTSYDCLSVTTTTRTSLHQTLPPQEQTDNETTLPESRHVAPFPVKFLPDNTLLQTQPKTRRSPSSKPRQPTKPMYAEVVVSEPKGKTSRKSKSARVKFPPFRPPRFNFPQTPSDIPLRLQTTRKMRFPPVKSCYTQPPPSAPMDTRATTRKSRKGKRSPYNPFEMGFCFSNPMDPRSIHQNPVQARPSSINLQNVEPRSIPPCSDYLPTISPDIPTHFSKHSKAKNSLHAKSHFPSKPKKDKPNPKKKRQIQHHPASHAGPSCLPQSAMPPSTIPRSSRSRSKRFLRDNPTHPVLPGIRHPPFESYWIRHPTSEPIRVNLPSPLESTDNQYPPRECSNIVERFPNTFFPDKSSSLFIPEVSKS